MALLLTCPHLRQSEEEAIIKTQKFIPDLKDEHEHYYNRLLVTGDMLQLDAAFNPVEHSPVLTTSPDPGGVQKSGRQAIILETDLEALTPHMQA